MIDLTLIGIGSGSPGHLTREAITAMNRADVILIPDKGADKADLAELRRALCAEVLTGDTRLVEFAMPVRDATDGYAAGVERWHDAIAERWEQAITRHKAQRPALLVWGDPSLYDSTLRIAERIGQRMPLQLNVIPGITAIQALCAAHAIPLNALAAPVLITTGRQLRDHGWPECADRIVVMLDGDCSFQGLEPQGVRIWWGAYLGMPNQLLDHGPLAEAAPRIIARRAEVRADHGWIMDIYLMQRDPA
ncbi:precorrin-6A synthase (deacetylating) [Paracoccus sulfuroxidans]|uniref:Precorrin-6A synthase [deacetylating] n=1 Tax=Paracoccus sulfuroxidans TaxID=384678 RepID=A0A562NQS7_9RHOB|nr:precorrin-6A synthase (deacetylating) [Paracoccus sulfuroxidans]TWI34542.1 precorrin-6A synthase (deacetylating) [Paracoccus sulfuroxidans]